MAALTLKSTRLCTLALGAALTLTASARAADVSVKLAAGSGFSVKDSTGGIERLRVDEGTGNVSRNGALFAHTTGGSNLFVGPGAGNPAATTSSGNSAFGTSPLSSLTTGTNNSALGSGALLSNTTGGSNSAVGRSALFYNTSGSQNSAFGDLSLAYNTTGSLNSAFGSGALRANTTGASNTAVGQEALRFNSTGLQNSAFGRNALRSNTTGFNNAAFGNEALRANTTGGLNAGVGYYALHSNTTGAANSAVGNGALLFNTAGNYNSAVGWSALVYNTTGSRNVAIGRYAGRNQDTGSDNIYLANVGASGESGQIKIGTVGTHVKTTVAGIFGFTSASGSPVLVNSSGVLGTSTSSAAFKEDVRDMGDTSSLLGKLHPVTFRYRPEVADGDRTLQYGLIAEEVAEVAPQLVVADAQGKPYSVRYHELPSLLLNEMQKQQHTLTEQARVIEAQRRENQVQQTEITALATRLARVESRVIGAQRGAQR